MKKQLKGFTLIELMIVVAIIGILAAIAIPNFLRYQLRAKFAELPTNVTAIFKSEQAIRQSERLGGVYQNLVTQPASACANVASGNGSTKRPWINTDRAAANALDWMVEGSTYGCYNALTTALQNGLTVAAQSDIDGDGVASCVGLYQTSFAGSGDVATGALSPANGCVPIATATSKWGIPDNLTPNVF